MPAYEPIRILIVDDHEMVRYSLRMLLEATSEFELVGEAASGEEAVRLCRALHPDVVLMDVLMPGIDGVEATRLIRNDHRRTQVVLLSTTKERNTEQAAHDAGAARYLTKNTHMSDLADALKQAAAIPHPD